MNPILIVLPILTILMFELGLTLRLRDFKLLAHNPSAVAIGLVGQLVVLPVIAFCLAWAFGLQEVFFVGIVLIACCPGGSSSNVFSMLAKGDVALSVTLTALSSVLTLFTIPIILDLAIRWSGSAETGGIHLPVVNLLMQNLLLVFVPILLGVATRKLWHNVAYKLHGILSKCAFPALMLLALIFFIQHHETIGRNIGLLGTVILLLILAAVFAAAIMCRLCRFGEKVRRTIVIEVGMQNAAQAIAIAGSPFIFNNDIIAIPAIIYALLMNVVLLTYVAVVLKRKA